MRPFALLALVTGCVSVPTHPPVLLDATRHTEFERDSISPLACPNHMRPVCEPLGRTGSLDCYCVH